MRTEKPYCLLRATEDFAPAPGLMRSAMTNAKASGWKTNDCGLLVATRVPPTADEAPSTPMDAPAEGAALTVCWDEGPRMIGGWIWRVIRPPASTPSAVATNCCRRPTSL